MIIGALLLLVLLLAGATISYLAREAKAMLPKPPEHGVCFSMEVELSSAQSTNAIADLKEAIKKRFSRFGARIFWEAASPTQFRVYAPIVDKEAIAAAGGLMSQRGHLELRLVHDKSRELVSEGKSEEGFEILQLRGASPPQERRFPQNYLVSTRPEGGPSRIQIRRAMANHSSRPDAYDICFTLTPESAEIFRRITQANVGRQLAIVVDGVLLSAPVIRAEIPGGSAVISGDFSRVEAVQLAALLESALPFPVKLVETKTF